jgi:hypothetical protein
MTLAKQELKKDVRMKCMQVLCDSVKLAVVACALLGTLVFLPSDSQAAPNNKTKKIVRIDRKITKLKRQLARQFAKLSDADKANVVAEIGDTSEDSDKDGLPDSLEDDDAVCNPDHDGDGVEDGDEFDDDDDDSAEVEESGILSAINENSLTVNSLVFTITEQTLFLGSKNIPRSRADFKPGICVEVEGHIGDALIADKIKFEDDC